MALITFATDDVEEAARIIEMLRGPKLGTAHAKAGKAAKAATDASAPVANDPVPERAAPPADTQVVVSHAPPAVAAVPPPAPTPAPAPPPPAAAPPPPAAAPAPAPVSEAPAGWTLEHITTQAATFIQHPKGGSDKLTALYARFGGIKKARECPPHMWPEFYSAMATELEAA